MKLSDVNHAVTVYGWIRRKLSAKATRPMLVP